MQLNTLGAVLVTLFDMTLENRRPSQAALAEALHTTSSELASAVRELAQRGLVNPEPLRLTMPGLALAAALGRQCRRSLRANPRTLAA